MRRLKHVATLVLCWDIGYAMYLLCLYVFLIIFLFFTYTVLIISSSTDYCTETSHLKYLFSAENLHVSETRKPHITAVRIYSYLPTIHSYSIVGQNNFPIILFLGGKSACAYISKVCTRVCTTTRSVQYIIYAQSIDTK